MEEEILEILKRLDGKFDKLESRFDKVEEGQNGLDLQDDFVEMKDAMNNINIKLRMLEDATRTNCFDIAVLRGMR